MFEQNKDFMNIVQEKVLTIIMGTMAFFSLAFSLDAFNSKNNLLGALNSISVLVMLVMLYILYKNKNFLFCKYVTVIYVMFFFAFLFISGGNLDSGYIWSLLFPLPTIFLLGNKKGIFFAIFYLLFMILSGFIYYLDLVEMRLPQAGVLIRLIAVYIVLLWIGFAYNAINKKNLKLLSDEISSRKQTEKELIIAKDKAEVANISKSRFLANMSHEIRTPMNGIVGFLQLLEMEDANKEQREYIEAIKTSTDLLLNVINDILDISKIEAGKIDLENISFDLSQVIDACVVVFKTKASEKKLDFNVLVNPKIPQFVEGDPTRLKQVITNLISNAIKFTHKGDIYVEVNLLENLQDSYKIQFKVKDSGIGMSEEALEKLFKPFSQADSSSTRKYGGTGLGLAIAKSIVEMMKGTIKVKSIEGSGTTFTFTVELGKSEHKRSNEKIIDYSILKGKKILVVDDNSINRNIVKLYLQDVGCVVDEAIDANDAIEKLVKAEGAAYNLALLDFNMPNMNGSDLASVLKAIPSTKKIPLVLLTSLALKGEAKKAKENGFAGYLSKPYNKRELLDCAVIVLDKNKRHEDEFVTRYTAKEMKLNRDLRILVAEDNDINAKFIQKLLKNKSLICDIAKNGEEAVKAYENKEYDLIFMDCQMPVLDGYDATRRIREIEEDTARHVLIIALTAYAMKGDEQKCIDAGMDYYLTKPVNVEKLDKILNECNV